ncbi:DUF7289 family protein [Halobaculum sp. D14]|uniref:DUF7289 family protein n=1 Tax=Halobaculum sp. D14 TaxID=3421642 RepID=UPI003EBB15DE
MNRRAQSHVVGVALLLGVTALSLAALTATIGAIVDENAAGVDADRVAADVDAALAPAAVTGPHSGRVAFTAGRLYTEPRTVRLLNDSGVVAAVPADALVYDAGSHRVAFLGGAMVRGRPGNAVVTGDAPVAVSAGTVVVGVAALGGERVDVSGDGRLTLSTRVSHDRTSMPRGNWRVAVETATPAAWERYFGRFGASVDRRDLDGDGDASVVASFPGERRAHLVVHRLRLEVYGSA